MVKGHFRGVAALPVAVLLLLIGLPAAADLVVYEGLSTTAEGTGDDYQADVTIRGAERQRVGCLGPWAASGSFQTYVDFYTRAAGLTYTGLETSAGSVEAFRTSSSSTSIKYVQRGLLYRYAPTDEVWLSYLFKFSGFTATPPVGAASTLEIMLVGNPTKEFTLAIDGTGSGTIRAGGDYGSIISLGVLAPDTTHMLVLRARDAASTDYDDLAIWLDPADLTNLGTPHYTGTGVFREQYAVDSINAYNNFRIQAAMNPAGYSAVVDELRIGTAMETGFPSGGTPGPVKKLGVDLGRDTGQDLYNFWAEAPDKVVQWDAADKTNPSRSFEEYGQFTVTFTEALEGNGTIDTRVRDDVYGPRGNLLEDAFKDAFGLKMLFEGLEAGDYAITTYHHDRNAQFRGSLDILVTDTQGTDRLVMDELMQTNGSFDDVFAFANFTFTANGVDDVIIQFVNGDTPGEEETEAWLDGFVLEHESTVVIPGDANRDGKVNELDAAILAAHWLNPSGELLGWGDGDFNGDGKVNDLDASILAANWPSGAGGTAVPEPSWAVLLTGALLLVGLRRLR